MLFKLIVSVFILTGLDSLYLSFFKKKFIKMITNIQKESFKLNIFGLVMSYFFLTLGLYFIIKNKLNYKNAFLFGFIVYGVYDMTNLALFNKWSLVLSLIDTIWGGLLFGTTIFLLDYFF